MQKTLNFWGIVVVIITLLTAAVWMLTRNGYVIRLSESDIEAVLDQRAPLTKTYFAVFDVTLSEPRVDLVEDSERVTAGVDVTLNIKVGDNQVPIHGKVDMSGGVEYRAESAEFFLTDPDIEALKIQGVPERYSDRTHAVIRAALEEFYEDRPLYSLQGEEKPKAAARLLLREVAVKNEKLVIRLGQNKS